jgi:polyphenol oxidase
MPHALLDGPLARRRPFEKLVVAAADGHVVVHEAARSLGATTAGCSASRSTSRSWCSSCCGGAAARRRRGDRAAGELRRSADHADRARRDRRRDRLARARPGCGCGRGTTDAVAAAEAGGLRARAAAGGARLLAAAGGVSRRPVARAQPGRLGGRRPAAVAENRRRVAAAFGVPARWPGSPGPRRRGARRRPGPIGGRATPGQRRPGVAAGVSAADCLPVLLLDRAAARWRPRTRGGAGRRPASRGRRSTRWRGTTAATPPTCRPGSGRPSRALLPGRAGGGGGRARRRPCRPRRAWPDPHSAGRWRLDVPAAVRAQLEAAGVPADAVSASATCTHCAADRCFSHRRDAGRTGRHWAVVRAARLSGRPPKRAATPRRR